MQSGRRSKWIFGLVVMAVASRWLPHPANFTPVIGLALYSGARFSTRKLALVVPMIAMLLSDLILGFHSTMWGTYGALAVITLGGYSLLREGGALKIGATALASSGVFFVITNFAVWVSENIYPHTTAGLVECFVAGIPFFPASLMSALLYTYGLFALEMGAIYLTQAFAPKVQRQTLD